MIGKKRAQAIAELGHSVNFVFDTNADAAKKLTQEFAPKAPVQPVPEGEEEMARRIIEIAKIALRAEKRGW